jgi:putative addiction module component (TIGR02574 family)
MEHDTDELLERTLKLPAEARAALAGSLIDSLDETVDEGPEEVWAAEIARRLDDLRAGRVTLIPWSEARRRIAGC